MQNLKNQKVGVLGLGDENLALVKYLVRKHTNVVICDRKSREELGEYYNEVKDLPVQFRLGEHYLDHLEDFAVVFRAPGLPYFNEKIQKAKKSGVEVSSQIRLFFTLCPCPIIGITGTKGKGTTTALTGDILKKAGKDVYIGGNIGQPPIDFTDKLTKDSIVVLELSSFQLQDIDRSPHIAVVLDIKVDHLDYHKDEAEYIDAKKNIVRYQKHSDSAVINADYLTSFEFAALTKAQVYYFSRRKSVDQGAFVMDRNLILRVNDKDTPIISIDKIQLRGEHNLENICAAATAAYLAGADIEVVKQGISTFRGLEHRLELVAEINGIKYYNDSFSTTPDTTIAAINSFSEPIILLAGGSEKNADYAELGEAIDTSSVKTVILMGVTTAPRIKAEIKNPRVKIIDTAKNIDEVMETVKSEMKPGDVVLLSPASASFDWFKNYKDRGNQFKDAVLRKFSDGKL